MHPEDDIQRYKQIGTRAAMLDESPSRTIPVVQVATTRPNYPDQPCTATSAGDQQSEQESYKGKNKNDFNKHIENRGCSAQIHMLGYSATENIHSNQKATPS